MKLDGGKVEGVPSLRWGILGAAGINRQFIPGLLRAGQSVQTIASHREGAAQKLANELGLAGERCPRCYEGPDAYSRLLADPTVDVVYVALANHLHKEAVLAAIEAGKPVLCEKPLGLNGDEAEQMVAASRQAGVRLAEAFMYRYLPVNLFALALRPFLGQVLLVRASFTGRYDPGRPNYRSQASLGGGALLDIGCYTVHTARLFLGELRVLAAHGRFADQDDGIDLTVSALLAGNSGSALVDCSFETSGSEQRYQVVGENGLLEVPVAYNPHGAPTSIRVRGQTLTKATLELFEEWRQHGQQRQADGPAVHQAEDGTLEVRFDPADPFAREAASFAVAVRQDWDYAKSDGSGTGTRANFTRWLPPPLPPEDAWSNMRILDAILALARAVPSYTIPADHGDGTARGR
ncbi:MAG: Gfo/Idh/MocA family oxidoreductase [Limnochordaceae bacterium]|nr:Gfo/Idh/MocA family oxidoreductase [Limnochordaceae bacterium]